MAGNPKSRVEAVRVPPDRIRNVVLVGHATAGKTCLVEAVLHEGVRVTFVDTPGHPDFVGEVRAGLRAADAALFVVSAADGVDGMTRMLWEECAAVGMPRAVVITHLEAARSNFEEMTRTCAEAFGGDD